MDGSCDEGRLVALQVGGTGSEDRDASDTGSDDQDPADGEDRCCDWKG